MEAMLHVFSALGLSSAAGLNAYLPLLIVALLARFTDLVQLRPPWDALSSWWAIGVLAALLIIEIVADKVPAVDTANDLINTVIRPAAGAILFAANSGTLGEFHPVLALLCGLVVAGGVHAVKATVRPLITAGTGGMGNWLVSTIEDIIAFITSLLAILLPIVIAVLVLGALVWLVQRLRHRTRRATG